MIDLIPFQEMDINSTIKDVTVKQYDHNSRFLRFELRDSDVNDGNVVRKGSPINLTGCNARLYVDMGGGDCAYIDGAIEDGEGGVVTFLLPNGVTSAPGTYRAEVWLTDPEDDSTISTKSFRLIVSESIRNDTAIEATEQFSALDNALRTVDNLDARMNALVSMADNGEISTGTIESEVVDARGGYYSGDYSSLHDAIEAAMNMGIDDDYRQEIDKAIENSHDHENANVLERITGELVTEMESAVLIQHSHGNKAVLDSITQDDVDRIHSGITNVTLEGTTLNFWRGATLLLSVDIGNISNG